MSDNNGRCDQCEVLMINGVRTHEVGCPVAWKEYKIECDWCGTEFLRDTKYQVCCEGCIDTDR